MARNIVNSVASITQRLRNIAREKNSSFQMILHRYAIERLLYRITQSTERNRFILKGAMLYTAWVPDPFRPTKDLDLLGFGDDAPPAMAGAFATICQQPVPDDGITFDVAGIRAEPIRGNQEYGGVKVHVTAHLGNIRIPLQIDIGFGDAVTPAIVDLTFPALLDAPAPQVRAYPKETVIAEKFEAIVAHGQANSRMKDYYDIVAIGRLFEFVGTTVRDAIAATFERRGTALPVKRPPGLSKAFARDAQKMALWSAFKRRESLLFDPGDLVDAIRSVNLFVTGPTKAARTESPFAHKWKPDGPWQAPRPTTPRKASPKKTKATRKQTPQNTPKYKEPELTAEQPDTRSQRQKFIDTAHEHGADGDQETFRNAVRKVATAPVPKDKLKKHKG
jgi:hypothetical protein